MAVICSFTGRPHTASGSSTEPADSFQHKTLWVEEGGILSVPIAVELGTKKIIYLICSCVEATTTRLSVARILQSISRAQGNAQTLNKIRMWSKVERTTNMRTHGIMWRRSFSKSMRKSIGIVKINSRGPWSKWAESRVNGARYVAGATGQWHSLHVQSEINGFYGILVQGRFHKNGNGFLSASLLVVSGRRGS